MKINEILNEANPNLSRQEKLADEKRKRDKLEQSRKRSAAAKKGLETKKKNLANIKHGEESSFTAVGLPDPDVVSDNTEQQKQQQQQQQDVDNWAQSQSEYGHQAQEPRQKSPEEEKISQDYEKKKAELANRRSQIKTKDDVVKNFIDAEIDTGERESDPTSKKGDQGVSKDSAKAYLVSIGYPSDEVESMLSKAPEKEKSDDAKETGSEKISTKQQKELELIRKGLQSMSKRDLAFLRKEIAQ